MKALNTGDDETANTLLLAAIGQEPSEIIKLRVYGMRYEPYTPYFYLGKIAFRSDDCEAAMDYWDTSLAQNVIQQTPSYRYLQQARQKCQSENQD